MSKTYSFDEVCRIPLSGDNCAMALQDLEAGTHIQYEGQTLTLNYTVMEGHRLAVQPINKGEDLLSWGLPFGKALRPIQPGDYVINHSVLEELNVRSLHFKLPLLPNFEDKEQELQLDKDCFVPAEPLPKYDENRTFMGYRRGPERGVGTRNTILILGTTSRTGSYAKQLSTRLQDELPHYEHIDGIVPIDHTEGGAGQPNNIELLLRTLAGFIVNPNTGAVLIVDDGNEPVTNEMLKAYLEEHNYPLHDVVHQFMTLSGSFQDYLAKGEAIVQKWLPKVNEIQRTPESIAHLKVALQCGGSDAFSGITANALQGWLAKELIHYGGSAVLAETDELIGAEPFVLQKVRDYATARKFLDLIADFKERTSWHGASAEGNPSGGNKYRGLYNIYLKSIGAAQKKDPASRLDYCLDYAERMQESGYHFMDSPGNDLESIAGQVASGCNLIYFSTGNGSITNFPFVPTVKMITTTQRFELLSGDMDINCGLYLDGLPMDELGQQSFELTLKIASGQLSVGEKAGHSQVQIWRNWAQTDDSQLESLLNKPLPDGKPIDIQTDDNPTHPIQFTYQREGDALSSDQIGLILPTSLCAGQVAHMIIDQLNAGEVGKEQVSRFVTLAHTEGCGNSGGPSEELYTRTMFGYMNHPMVHSCLLLEHGCERTHNEFMQYHIKEMGGDISQLGFASIQLDGGIDKVKQKVENWFKENFKDTKAAVSEAVGLEALKLGLMSDGPFRPEAAEQLAALTKMVVSAGGTVTIPENSELLATPAFQEHVLKEPNVKPSLAYGQHAQQAGFHIMETPTQHWVETVTGLAATGIELIVALVNECPMQVHPFVPIIQVASESFIQKRYGQDLDLLLADQPDEWNDQILNMIKGVIEKQYTPKLFQQGNIDFQFTRGLLGISL